MAVKRNRWLIGGVLTVALAAFLAISLLPLLGTSVNRSNGNHAASTAQTSEDALNAQRQELETRANGYVSVLEREPDNQTALRGLVEARIQLGDLTGVIEPLEKLAALNPDIPDYRVLLGQTKQQNGDLEGAAQAYRTVLDTNPGNMNALQGLVALMMTQERPQAAIGLLQDTLNGAEQANQVQPNAIDVTSVQLLLGQVYVEESRYDEALTLYEQAIAARPDDFRPLLAKALVLRDQGQLDAAEPLFANAIALAPDQYKDQIAQLAQSQDTLESPLPEPDAIAPEPDATSAEPDVEPTPAQAEPETSNSDTSDPEE